MAEHVMLELDRNVVERAERLVDCGKFCVKNIQRNFVVLPLAVTAVVSKRAAQAAGGRERMRQTHAKFCMIGTESVHATWTTARTVVLETSPFHSPPKEQDRSAAVIVLSSESGGI
jgi:hypothetical protein